MLEINGVNVLNPANSPRAKFVNAVFAFDAGSDGVTNLANADPGDLRACRSSPGVDEFVPAAKPARRHDLGRAARRGSVGVAPRSVNVPNWSSSTDAITVQFHEYPTIR